MTYIAHWQETRRISPRATINRKSPAGPYGCTPALGPFTSDYQVKKILVLPELPPEPATAIERFRLAS